MKRNKGYWWTYTGKFIQGGHFLVWRWSNDKQVGWPVMQSLKKQSVCCASCLAHSALGILCHVMFVNKEGYGGGMLEGFIQGSQTRVGSWQCGAGLTKS